MTVGQWAITVGVGYGDINPAISTGIISAKNRIGGRAIQTDANTSPANYGGPLLDIYGRLIGVCVPLNPQRQEVGAGVEWYDSGIGFAIPVSGLESIINRLKAGEKIYPSFLGVRTEANPEGNGVRVAEVIVKSAAAQAGLQHADVITKINDQPINDLMELKKVLYRFEEGTEVSITFIPFGEDKEKTERIRLGRPPVIEKDPSPMEPPKIR